MSTTGSTPVNPPEDPVPGLSDVAGRRYVAPGGWKRALIGVAVGVVAGALVAGVLPRPGSPADAAELEG